MGGQAVLRPDMGKRLGRSGMQGAGGGEGGGETRSKAAFSREALGRALRGYQEEVTAQILRSIRCELGLTITVMMARQMGKNELSAHIEAYLLDGYAKKGGSIVKAAPTFRPQVST